MNGIFPSRIICGVTVENVKAELLVSEGATSVPKELIHTSFHTHSYTELFVCMSGEVTIITESGRLKLLKNDLGIVPSNLPHILESVSYDGICYSVGIMLTRRSDTSVYDLYSQLSEILLSDRGTVLRGVKRACENVEALTAESGKAAVITSLRFILSLAEKAEALFSEEAKEKSGVQALEINRISRLETVIDRFFTENLTAAEAARILYISQRQLSRIVKKRYGMTFHRIITEKRLSASVKLLMQSEFSAEKIAEAVGFGSVGSFYREFSKKYGMSPSVYKKRGGRP